MCGIGPVIELPTGGEKQEIQKWRAGSSFVVHAQPGGWTFGVLINNTWSFAGNSDRDNVNHMLLNLFMVRQLGGGWCVNSAPIILPIGLPILTFNGLFRLELEVGN